MCRLPGHRRVVARFEFCETSADLHLVVGGFFPEVGHHFGPDQAGELCTIGVEHFMQLVFRVVLRLVVGYRLTGQVVEQLGLREVVDVVVVDQLLDDVVLEALLPDARFTAHGELMVRAQLLADDLPLPRLKVGQ